MCSGFLQDSGWGIQNRMDLNAQTVFSIPKFQFRPIVQKIGNSEQYLIHLGQGQNAPFQKPDPASRKPLVLS